MKARCEVRYWAGNYSEPALQCVRIAGHRGDHVAKVRWTGKGQVK